MVEFECERCHKVLSSKVNLINHMNKVDCLRLKRTCPDCKHVYSSTWKLNDHIRKGPCKRKLLPLSETKSNMDEPNNHTDFILRMATIQKDREIELTKIKRDIELAKIKRDVEIAKIKCEGEMIDSFHLNSGSDNSGTKIENIMTKDDAVSNNNNSKDNDMKTECQQKNNTSNGQTQQRDSQKQHKFRDELIKRYGVCQITGTSAKYCDAVHIIPYKKHQNFDVNNGLLLRSDLHRAFDLGHLLIDHETGEIKFEDNATNVNGIKIELCEKTKYYLKLKCELDRIHKNIELAVLNSDNQSKKSKKNKHTTSLTLIN